MILWLPGHLKEAWVSLLIVAQALPLLMERSHVHKKLGHCRLEDIGFGVGLRLLELLVYRERASRRQIQLVQQLLFLQTTLWRYLFGHDAQNLEQSNAVSRVVQLWNCQLDYFAIIRLAPVVIHFQLE